MDRGWLNNNLTIPPTDDDDRGPLMKVILGFFFFLSVTCLPAWAWALKAGPVYMDRPGEIDVFLEVLPGGTLNPSDFQLLLDNQSVAPAKEIKTFDSSGKAMALLICADISGAVGEEKLKALKAALFYLIGRAAYRPEDRIALILFADQITSVTSFQQDREQLVIAVKQFQANASSARLYDVLSSALNLFDGQDLPKRRRMIFISDGKDEGSKETLEKVISKAKALGVPIDGISHGTIDPMLQKALIGITEPVGGQFIEANPEVISLKEGLKELYGALLETRSWMVYFSYEADLAEGETQDAAIKVTLPGQKSLVVNIPGTYAHPKQAVSKTPESKEITPLNNKRESKPAKSSDQSWFSQNRLLASVIAVTAILVTAFVIFLLLRRLRTQKKVENLENRVTEVDDGPIDDTVVFPVPTTIPPPPDTEISPASTPITMVGGYVFPPPEQGKPSAELVGIDGPLVNARYAIIKEKFLIGRAEANDLCISDDEYVSRNHAYLRYEKGSLFIFDNGSAGGTFVNQNKIIDTGAALEPGDQIRIGASTFEVRKHHWEQN